MPHGSRSSPFHICPVFIVHRYSGPARAQASTTSSPLFRSATRHNTSLGLAPVWLSQQSSTTDSCTSHKKFFFTMHRICISPKFVSKEGNLCTLQRCILDSHKSLQRLWWQDHSFRIDVASMEHSAFGGIVEIFELSFSATESSSSCSLTTC